MPDTVLSASDNCCGDVRSSSDHGIDDFTNATAVAEFVLSFQILFWIFGSGSPTAALKALMNDSVAGIGSGRCVIIFSSSIQFSKWRTEIFSKYVWHEMLR